MIQSSTDLMSPVSISLKQGTKANDMRLLVNLFWSDDEFEDELLMNKVDDSDLTEELLFDNRVKVDSVWSW